MDKPQFEGIYTSEPITRKKLPEPKTPEPILRARRLAEGGGNVFKSRERIFYEQARLLEDYEDDYVITSSPVRYFPTYQSFDDKELRGYFSWRTRVRKGDIQKTALSFAYLYIYELLNLIGCSDPMDGYMKLKSFADLYSERYDNVKRYTDSWLFDMAVYYRLDPELLKDNENVLFDERLLVILGSDRHSPEELTMALAEISGYRVDRSAFCKAYFGDYCDVMAMVWKRMKKYFAGHRKVSLIEFYFGFCISRRKTLFYNAIFLPQKSGRDFEYEINAIRRYTSRSGEVSLTAYYPPSFQLGMLRDLMRTVDSVMREHYEFSSPLAYRSMPKWNLKIIHDACKECSARKQEAEKRIIKIDLSALSRIREDSEEIKDRLIIDESSEEGMLPEEPDKPLDISDTPAEQRQTVLSEDEERLMRCLMYGGELSWLRDKGIMPEVITDSINEKLFDMFDDTVLEYDGDIRIIEDYVDELREVIRP